MTQDRLIPTNGIHIVETHYPAGYNVARYDAEGLTADGRWFETLEKAREYEKTIRWSRRPANRVVIIPRLPAMGVK